MKPWKWVLVLLIAAGIMCLWKFRGCEGTASFLLPPNAKITEYAAIPSPVNDEGGLDYSWKFTGTVHNTGGDGNVTVVAELLHTDGSVLYGSSETLWLNAGTTEKITVWITEVGIFSQTDNKYRFYVKK